MIPLRDLLPTYTRPVVTWSIVGINAIVFLVVASDLDAAARALGAVPYHFTGMEPEVVAGRDAFGNVYRLEPVPQGPFFMARVMTNSSMPTAKMVLYSSDPCGVSPRLT